MVSIKKKEFGFRRRIPFLYFLWGMIFLMIGLINLIFFRSSTALIFFIIIMFGGSLSCFIEFFSRIKKGFYIKITDEGINISRYSMWGRSKDVGWTEILEIKQITGNNWRIVLALSSGNEIKIPLGDLKKDDRKILIQVIRKHIEDRVKL